MLVIDIRRFLLIGRGPGGFNRVQFKLFIVFQTLIRMLLEVKVIFKKTYIEDASFLIHFLVKSVLVLKTVIQKSKLSHREGGHGQKSAQKVVSIPYEFFVRMSFFLRTCNQRKQHSYEKFVRITLMKLTTDTYYLNCPQRPPSLFLAANLLEF